MAKYFFSSSSSNNNRAAHHCAIVAAKLLLFFTFLLLSISTAESSRQPAAAKCGGVTCQKFYAAQSGDNCAGVAAKNHMSEDLFKALNPGVNCYNIFVYQWLCVKGIPV
ncbi:unnamed protein product [Linum tenue]|uniref:LysM domain-containing protein n=1 Tax=Linum tenue TaxID=586396 RepID=A0AAV0GVA1_9ROSI|nr:unnamed protein product [Linum tenue]